MSIRGEQKRERLSSVPPLSPVIHGRPADGNGFGGNLYKVTKWDHAGHFEMASNDGFRGKKPIIQHVNYTLYRVAAEAVSDYKAGVGDMVAAPIAPSDDLHNLKGTNYSAIRASI